MKHGPIALIDENMPVSVFLLSGTEDIDKVRSNMEEVAARGGKVVAVVRDASVPGRRTRSSSRRR
jgi:glucosamine--fructose-6-phosphate aminotransferase (isomerizing)